MYSSVIAKLVGGGAYMIGMRASLNYKFLGPDLMDFCV
jgi:hypothetical protein